MIKLFVEYDNSLMSSYQYFDWIYEHFSKDQHYLNEIRDSQGILKGFEVFIKK